MTTSADPLQYSFDELEPSLDSVTFVVVDLETTGGSAANDAITEVGAVKVRGGEVLGEFATLVDPGRPIPPQIVMLTNITDAMVTGAPRLDTVLPAFLEFARGCVLVAHNAPFDIGFLRAACGRMDLPWPQPPVVDTVRLARRALDRTEVPSVRLGILAPLLGARVQPDHRALHDARATVDVLHALLERLGSFGVVTLTDLCSAQRRIDPARRAKRHLADRLPATPGVYLFRAADDEVLYVGTSNNLRARVRSYFTAAEARGRIQRMVLLADRVDHVECATALEAEVREQRLIAAHQPRYNRRSKDPGRAHWIRLTTETFPRLSITRTPPAPDQPYVGPFRSMSRARHAVEAVQAAIPVRRCTQRLARDPHGSPCALYELGHCGGPCAGHEGAAEYAAHLDRFTALAEGRSDALLRELDHAMQRAAAAGRYRHAAVARDNMSCLVDALILGQRLAALAAIGQLVAARPDGSGGWEVAVVRYGRLAAAGVARRGTDPIDVIDRLCASAETVLPAPGPLPGASAEETSTVLRFIEDPATRLVRISEPWAQPACGAGRWEAWARAAAAAREQGSGYDRPRARRA